MLFLTLGGEGSYEEVHRLGSLGPQFQDGGK